MVNHGQEEQRERAWLGSVASLTLSANKRSAGVVKSCNHAHGSMRARGGTIEEGEWMGVSSMYKGCSKCSARAKRSDLLGVGVVGRGRCTGRRSVLSVGAVSCKASRGRALRSLVSILRWVVVVVALLLRLLPVLRLRVALLLVRWLAAGCIRVATAAHALVVAQWLRLHVGGAEDVPLRALAPTCAEGEKHDEEEDGNSDS